MKLLILDRDGVINYDSDAYIKSVEEWIPLPGSIEAIAQLSKAGWTVAVATNQSGIARGYYPTATLDAMHERLRGLGAQLLDQQVDTDDRQFFRASGAVGTLPLGPLGFDVGLERYGGHGNLTGLKYWAMRWNAALTGAVNHFARGLALLLRHEAGAVRHCPPV